MTNNEFLTERLSQLRDYNDIVYTLEKNAADNNELIIRDSLEEAAGKIREFLDVEVSELFSDDEEELIFLIQAYGLSEYKK